MNDAPSRTGFQSSIPWLRVVALASLLAMAGCTTVSTVPSAPPTAAANATIARASELARNNASLSAEQQRTNSAEIDRLLGSLDNATLAAQAAALPPGDPLYRFAGRALISRGLPLPRPLDRGQWRAGADTRPPADRDGYRPALKLGVLLPLSGELSKAAVPVRDGLLAGYYGESRRRPDIVFYDTAGTPGGATAAYGRAVAEGADYVVGPLGRDEVSALFHQSLTVPVLALNRGAVAPPTGSGSFSLAPEDDGIAAAEFLLARNARHVLVLSDPSLQRAVAAFRTHLESRGGQVSGALPVSDKSGDMSLALKAAAAAPAGVDAVFLATKPAEARMLMPQLAAAGLAGKLRVSTSQLAASESATADRVLDGIAFPTEAWDVANVPGLPSPAASARLLPSARGAAAKLFAFGHDAWLLSAYLEYLATQADANIRGATGTLRLDGFGNVVRSPAWSTFSNGAIVPLASSAGGQ